MSNNALPANAAISIRSTAASSKWLGATSLGSGTQIAVGDQVVMCPKCFKPVLLDDWRGNGNRCPDDGTPARVIERATGAGGDTVAAPVATASTTGPAGSAVVDDLDGAWSFEGSGVSVEVEGTPAGLRRLGQWLGEAAAAGAATWLPLSGPGNPDYDAPLRGLRVLPGTGALHVQVRDGVLEMAGDREGIDGISHDVLRLAATGRHKDHLHIEYFDSHPFLTPESASLVIMLKRVDSL